MILHFKTTIIYCFIIGILIISFKRTSAQVYQYNSIENTDFEVNPAYFGIKNNNPEFLGNVSHELKTPLFSIQGYVDILLDGDPQI
jgi:signal transduction histidine kinase